MGWSAIFAFWLWFLAPQSPQNPFGLVQYKPVAIHAVYNSRVLTVEVVGQVATLSPPTDQVHAWVARIEDGQHRFVLASFPVTYETRHHHPERFEKIRVRGKVREPLRYAYAEIIVMDWVRVN